MRYTKYAVSAAVFGCLLARASAFDLNFGFEVPDYNDGDALTGSNGWQNMEGTTTPSGLIQGGIVKTGEQALLFQGTGFQFPTWGAVLEHNGLVPNAEQPICRMEWDMYAMSGTQQSDVWGAGSVFGSERLIVGIDAQNKLNIRGAWIGNVMTNIPVARNTWNHYRIDFDYTAKTGKVYLNEGFVGTYNIGNGPVEHKYTAIYNRFGGNDGAVFDNMSIQSAQAVPEPATLAVAFMGLAGIVARKRKK